MAGAGEARPGVVTRPAAGAIVVFLLLLGLANPSVPVTGESHGVGATSVFERAS